MNKMAAIILQYLGVTEFSKKDGKPTLTKEQRSQVEATFGKEFTDKFADYLAKDEQKSDENSGNQTVAELINALTAAQQSSAQALEAKFEKQINALTETNKTLQSQVEALANEPEKDPLPEMSKTIPRKEGVAAVMKIDMRKPIYAEAGHFLERGFRNMSSETLAQSIDIADLKNDFGTYLSQGRNNLEMIDTLYQGFTSSQYFTSKMAITERRAIQALISSVSQQFVPKWTPSGKSTFRPLKIANRRHKINFEITPAEVLDSYMMHLYDERMSPDQMPISLYIINNMLYPQLLQDIETRMIFKGKFDELNWGAVNENDAGQAPEKSMDGIETILTDNKAENAANIRYFPDTVLDFMSLTSQEMLDYVRDYVRWLAPVFRIQAMPIACSDEFYRKYRESYKEVWGPGSDKSDRTDFGSNKIDFSRQYLVPMDGMYGSPILYATPKMNHIKLRNFNEAPRVINNIQLENYKAKIFGEYWLGVGFDYGEAVFASVPDGYDPYAQIVKYYDAHDTYQQNKGVLGSGSAGGGL